MTNFPTPDITQGDIYILTKHWRQFPVGSMVPANMLKMMGFDFEQEQAFKAEGGLLSREDFPDLYAVIGYVFGRGEDDKFRVPDLRARIVTKEENDE